MSDPDPQMVPQPVISQSPHNTPGETAPIPESHVPDPLDPEDLRRLDLWGMPLERLRRLRDALARIHGSRAWPPEAYRVFEVYNRRRRINKES